MTIPDTPQVPAPALPALAAFPFPTALVVTGRSAAGEGVLLEAGDVDEVFPFASVTKPIVAWAALVAVDRGLLDLGAPAGSPAPDGATIENLLSHSSGIAADSDERLAAPGTRRIYSNRGIEILGERLEEATGTPLETWVETTVLEPLGMASVLIPGSPAHSGEGSARDLSLFARELAAPRLVSPALAQRARTPVLSRPSGTSASRAPSSGWIRSPSARPSSWGPSPSGRFTGGPGPSSATRSWPYRACRPCRSWRAGAPVTAACRPVTRP